MLAYANDPAFARRRRMDRRRYVCTENAICAPGYVAHGPLNIKDRPCV